MKAVFILLLVPCKSNFSAPFSNTLNLFCSYNKSEQDALFLNFILVKNSTCFGQISCPSSGVSTLYSQQ